MKPHPRLTPMSRLALPVTPTAPMKPHRLAVFLATLAPPARHCRSRRRVRCAALLAAFALFFSQHAAASPRQNTNPAQRALTTQQQRSAQEQARRERMRPGIVLVLPSPNQVIGKVSRVNLAEGFVVGWLHTRYLNLSGHIITRDEQLRTTATLSPGSARNNRAAGLKIESGVPNVGDEIVVVTATQQTLPGQTTGANAPQQAQGAANTQQAQGANALQQAQGAANAQQPPPSLKPRWQMQPASAQAANAQPAAQGEQPQLIPARHMRNLSNVKPEVETRITVTVE